MSLNVTPRLTQPQYDVDFGQMRDYLDNCEPDYEPTEHKFLVFFFVGTDEYQSTVMAYSHDHALEVWCRDNREGEYPEAVMLSNEERNF